MSLRSITPCDYGYCPYDAEYSYTCEYWCGAPEPEDYPEIEEEDWIVDEEKEENE